MAEFIKKIKASDNVIYEIDAKKWDGHSFDEITDLVHGVVDTYVIPAQSSNKTADYIAIVEASSAQVSTTVSKLGTLTGTPADNWDKFGVGDIVLMGATSDGIKNFDRWISSVSGTGVSATVTLDVLETQVATHHHTLNIPVATVSRTLTPAKALTSATPTSTSANVAKVGTTVNNVLTGESGNVLTNVEYSDSGSYSLNIVTGASTDYGHKHTVVAHSHTATFKPSTYVSRTLSAYYSLTSKSHTPHTHTNVSVAGTPANSSEKTYVTGVSTSAQFIKTLKDSAQTTGANTTALVTDDIAADVVTASSGTHTHSVSATTTEKAIKTVSLQANVVTSVKHSYTAPIVQANVVTSVTKVSKTAVTSATLTGTKTFVNTATVTDGVLSFGTSTVGISAPTTTISGINIITSGTQNAGSASFSFTSGTQTYTSGTLTATCTTGSSGAHTHGFSHTHAISSHTHSYNKSVTNTSGYAITSLVTDTLSTHTHNNVSVAGAHEDGDAINIVTGGSATSVVRDLKNSDQTITSATAAPDTSTVYGKITGTITHPGLSLTRREFGNTSITPAADSGEKAIKSITFGSSSSFVTDVTITTTSGSIKTSPNKGGN